MDKISINTQNELPNSEVTQPLVTRTCNCEKIIEQTPRVTFTLIMGVIMATAGLSYQLGYNMSVLNGPKEQITFYFYPCNESKTNKTCNDNLQKMREINYAVITATLPASAVAGSLLIPTFLHRFGRKKGMLFSTVFSIFAALFFSISKATNSIWVIFIGRIFIGIFIGLASGLVPTYLIEISPKQWRGAIGVFSQLFITIGILIAQVLSLEVLLGSASLWPVLLAFTFLPTVIILLGSAVMPKSPRYLMLDAKDEELTEITLIKLRGSGNVRDEIQEIQEEGEAAIKTKVLSIMELLKEKSVKWQLITVSVMHVAQQLCGINAVFFYTNSIFNSANIQMGQPQDITSIAVSSVYVIITVVAVLIIEPAGRKKLIVYGFASMVLSCILLTIVLTTLESQQAGQTLTPGQSPSSISYWSMAFVVLYIVSFALGPGPVTWVLTAELFTQETRPAATSIGCTLNWVCNFFVILTFPSMHNGIGAYVFLLFMIVCLGSTVYLHVVLVETKGKTFKQIHQVFAKRNGLETPVGNNVMLELLKNE